MSIACTEPVKTRRAIDLSSFYRERSATLRPANGHAAEVIGHLGTLAPYEEALRETSSACDGILSLQCILHTRLRMLFVW